MAAPEKVTEPDRLPLLDPDPGVSASLYRLADEIVGRLSPGALPAFVTAQLRHAAEFGQRTADFVLSPEPDLVRGRSTIYPDGSLYLELSDRNGYIFWRAHLRAPA